MVASDGSGAMIERARARGSRSEPDSGIDYRVIDATDRDQLMALGERRFDAAVCSMALMDLATIEPLVSALARLLRPGGRFVFSVSHPCFNTSGTRKAAELEDRDGELVTVRYVKVFDYIEPSVAKGIGIPDQPLSQYNFERPISVLFNTCFQAGFALDGIEEPVARPEHAGSSPFSWANFKQIPSVMVARMRPLA